MAMSTTITLEEAQARLTELVLKLAPGEEVIITQDQRPVAKLVGEQTAKRKPRKPGNCKGLMTIISDDHEHLKDFEELNSSLATRHSPVATHVWRVLARMSARQESVLQWVTGRFPLRMHSTATRRKLRLVPGRAQISIVFVGVQLIIVDCVGPPFAWRGGFFFPWF